MKKSLLNHIECPLCRSQLDLLAFEEFNNEIKTGILACKRNPAHLFPIANEIPRLLGGIIPEYYQQLMKFLHLIPESVKGNMKHVEQQNKKYQHIQKSFSSEWEELGDDMRAWGQDTEERRKLFFEWTDMNAGDLKGKRMLDAGCGHGEVELALSKTEAEIFAIDISSSVDRVWAKIKSSGSQAFYHVIQANIHQIPFKEDQFDLVHSAGVLHHTPDTLIGFENITRCLKAGGRGYIEVYSNDHKGLIEKSYYWINRPVRAITYRLPFRLLHMLCYAVAPALWLFITIGGLLQPKRYVSRTFKELELSLFDYFSPRYQFHHTTTEVFNWFKNLGYTDLKKTLANHNVIGVVGVKLK